MGMILASTFQRCLIGMFVKIYIEGGKKEIPDIYNLHFLEMVYGS